MKRIKEGKGKSVSWHFDGRKIPPSMGGHEAKRTEHQIDTPKSTRREGEAKRHKICPEIYSEVKLINHNIKLHPEININSQI